MKLINPTKEMLNAAFAEKVVGWHRDFTRHDGRFLAADLWKALPHFTDSMDAVLPYLEKGDWLVDISFYNHAKPELRKFAWVVTICGDTSHAGTIPLACVIAPLRANGVEVEYTEDSPR